MLQGHAIISWPCAPYCTCNGRSGSWRGHGLYYSNVTSFLQLFFSQSHCHDQSQKLHVGRSDTAVRGVGDPAVQCTRRSGAILRRCNIFFECFFLPLSRSNQAHQCACRALRRSASRRGDANAAAVQRARRAGAVLRGRGVGRRAAGRQAPRAGRPRRAPPRHAVSHFLCLIFDWS